MRSQYREQSDFFGYLLLIIGCGILLLAGNGCSGLGLKIEGYRIDQRSESQKTFDRPSSGFCSIFPSRCSQSAATVKEETVE